MKQKIIDYIHTHGPIDTATYMQKCLYDPTEGYYTTRTPFGPKADFITAPELTPLFGEMLGLWVAATWQSMGMPKTFNLIEIGPGRGVLFEDMYRALKKAAPQCLAACQGHLVEISPHLTKLQQKTLSAIPGLKWHQSIDTCPKNALTITIGNEVLDAFPVTQYIKQDDGFYYKRLIHVQEGQLTFTTGKTQHHFNSMCPIYEQSTQMHTFLTKLKNHQAQPHIALLIDYGTATTPQEHGDSLQAVRNHKHENIFIAPGKADLTWHIPFLEVCATLGAAHCLTDMALFLTEIGFHLRAEQAHRAAQQQAQKQHIEETTKRLLDPNDMGRHFKVLGWSNIPQQNFIGFNHCNK